jgi:ferredoxin-type protein NapH
MISRRRRKNHRADSGEAGALDAVQEGLAAAAGAAGAAVPGALDKPDTACAKDCSSCATKRAKLDSRHLVLAGSLLSAAVFGFPVFCLICPIGLIFGTVIVVWQFIGFDDVSLSLLIYPAILIVELLVLRKWCARFCPLGALLSLLSLPNRLLRPKVEVSKCLREKGSDCHICQEVCPEGVDPHFSDSMNECSKCAICIEECPAKAITIPLKQ